MIKKRAQAWGYDLIAGLTIFVIGIFTFYLFSLNYSNGADTKLAELEYEGRVIGDALLSEGYPEYWSVQNFTDGKLERVGLLSNGIINQSKLNQFYQIGDYGVNANNYQKSKAMFSLKDNYWINFTDTIAVEDSGGTTVVVSGIGKILSGERNVIKVTRLISNGTNLNTVNIFIWN